MKTSFQNQLRQNSESEAAAVPGPAPACATDTDVSDTGVSDVATGIAEVLRMRVGCWQAPIFSTPAPTAA
jgi:hypothetical protein